MSSIGVSHWVQDWGPLLTLISAVLLTLVTAWLAWVTTRMAKGAKDAAEYSKTAAQASLASAAAIQASASVEFTLAPLPVTNIGKMLELLKDMVAKDVSRGRDDVDVRWFDPIMAIKRIGLRCDGSAVYIHGGRIIEICREGRRIDSIECEATQIALLAASVVLPYRLHKGESLAFGVAGFQPGERIVRITAFIDYSFDDRSAMYQRLVIWNAGPRKSATVKAIETHKPAKPDR